MRVFVTALMTAVALGTSASPAQAESVRNGLGLNGLGLNGLGLNGLGLNGLGLNGLGLNGLGLNGVEANGQKAESATAPQIARVRLPNGQTVELRQEP